MKMNVFSAIAWVGWGRGTKARPRRRAGFIAALLLAGSVGSGARGATEPLYGLTEAGTLLKFNLNKPQTLTGGATAFTGLQTGETIVGIDVRSVDGTLYAQGSQGNLYTVKTGSMNFGAASLVTAPPLGITLSGSRFGFDISPDSDRARIVSNTGQNFRINPQNGKAIDGDSTTDGTQGDSALSASNVVEIAFNYLPETGRAPLFGIQVAGSTGVAELVRQGTAGGSTTSQNGGNINNVAPLTLDTDSTHTQITVSNAVGFDIAGDGAAYTALTIGNITKLYSLNLTTGVLTSLGKIGDGTQPLIGLSDSSAFTVVPEPNALGMIAVGIGVLTRRRATSQSGPVSGPC